MLVLFVGWGAFFLFVLFRFRKGANPKASYAGAQGQDLEEHRSRRRDRRSRPARVLRHSGVGDARHGSSRPRARRSSSASSASSSRGTCTIPGPDGKFGRTDVKLVAADNPLGLDRTRSGREGRHHDDQPAEPAGRSAGARAPVEQGRHPQLRPLRDAREAGRDSGPGHPGLVHPELASAITRSPARSSAASVTTGCAAS